MIKGRETNASQTWQTRNDSSNVASLLEPDKEPGLSMESIKERLVLVSNKCYQVGIDPIYRYPDCYCKKLPIQPKHVSSLVDQIGHKSSSHSVNQLRKMSRRKGFAYNNEAEKYYPANFLPMDWKKCRCRTCFTAACCRLYPDTQEEPGEETVIDVEQEYKKTLEKCDDAAQTDTFSRRVSPTEIFVDEELKTHDRATSPKSPCRSSMDLHTETETTIQQLSTYLQDNFKSHAEETHQEKKIPEHKCVHKFVLNDRLIPQPVNPDPAGFSSCCICDKSLRDHEPEASIRVIQEDGPSVGKTSMLTPNRINLVNRKNKIEIRIPSNLNHVPVKAKRVNVKPQVPTNSFALRHQKGIVKQ